MEKHTSKRHYTKIQAETHHSRETGCPIRCTREYIENHEHSHRWNAAKNAREHRSIYEVKIKNGRKKINLDDCLEIDTWSTEKMEKFLKNNTKAVAKHSYKSARGREAFKLKPFYRAFYPFMHQAHHIIPCRVLLNQVDWLRKEVGAAGEAFAWEIAMNGILNEPYNINSQPNMIILPTEQQVSKDMGLPTHVGSHSTYSAKIEKFVHRKFSSAYKSVIPKIKDEVKKPKEKRCDGEKIEAPAIRKRLEGISKAVFNNIISLAKIKRSHEKYEGWDVDDSIDDVNRDLARKVRRGIIS